MPEFEENKYWRLFISGDLDALSVSFRLYVPGLMAYGLKIYPDEELVKDSVQDVFVKLITKRSNINLNNSVKGFVYRLLRNQLIDEIKIINKRRTNEQNGAYPSDCFEFDTEQVHIRIEEENRINDAVSLAIVQLSSYQREIIFLKYTNGLSYEEISRAMGINIASARTSVYRVLKQIKVQLADLRRNKE